MFLLDLLFAFVVAVLLTAILSAGFRNRGPWGIWWVLLLVLFLVTWAGGVWVTPFGPPVAGSYWLPFIVVGFVFALLMAAVVPARPRRPVPYGEPGAGTVADEEAAAVAVIGVFFWVLMVGLALAILLRYV